MSPSTDKMLLINEIFYSIQGESTWSGLPCTFVRLTGCHLRCTYCDTEYAFYEGRSASLEEVLNQVRRIGCPRVEVTGGEPLLQPAVIPFMHCLLAEKYTVLLETSGALSIEQVPKEVHKIIDIKCPDSGMSDHFDWNNIPLLNRERDEIKFVISSRRDYEWAKKILTDYRLEDQSKAVLFSPTHDLLSPRELADWLLHDHLPARIQLQLHKKIWPDVDRGV